jgi:hypothetical protein
MPELVEIQLMLLIFMLVLVLYILYKLKNMETHLYQTPIKMHAKEMVELSTPMSNESLEVDNRKASVKPDPGIMDRFRYETFL